MLNIVTFLWTPPKGYRSKYGPEHVHILRNMIARNYRGGPWSLWAITDFPRDQFATDIQVFPLWNDHADVPNPHGTNNPSCYRRLKLWSDWPERVMGPGARILQLDLDMVIVGDVTPLWTRPEPIVFWEDQLNRHNKINGAMQLFTAGIRPSVWNDFDPERSPMEAMRARNWGSDQAWLSHKIKNDWARWTAADGAYSWRVHCEPMGGVLPPGARIVNFHGATDPEHVRDRIPWVAEHYR